MAAPTFALTTTGSDPKATTKATLEQAVQAVVDALQDSIDTTALAGAIGTGTVYQSTAAGLAATSNGDTFMVAASGQLVAYLNDGGSATELATLPTQTQMDSALMALARRFELVTDMTGDALLTYTSGSVYTISSGTILEAEGFRYEVKPLGTAQGGASGYHLANANGVLLRALPGDDGALNLAALNPANDGTTDDSDIIEMWLDYAGDVNYGSGSFPEASPDTAARLYAPAGDYRFTRTLTVHSNTIFEGAGWGAKFKFDPAVANSDAFVTSAYDGDVINGASIRFRDFMLYVAEDGSTATGRNGSALDTVNSNSRHGINATDATGVTCERVYFGSFHYGTGFYSELVDPTFAFYNTLIHCYFRDCFQPYKLTSSSQAIACYVGHGSRYPAQSRMAAHQYVIDTTDTRGCSFSGSIECYASVALVNDNNAGHSFSGLYLEAYDDTPAVRDGTTETVNAAASFWGGASYGYTPHMLHQEAVTRTGNSNFNMGTTYSFGDCVELELAHLTTRQAPSFRWGLPSRGHFPAGGTITEAEGWIDDSCLELSRAAGTSTTNNQVSYNFQVRGTRQMIQNIWVTILVKFEGGETADDCSLSLSAPQNAIMKKLITFQSGWELWGTYVEPSANETFTLLVAQVAGSTDTARKLKFTGLRAYANGFKPVPVAYAWPERRSAAPTAGLWMRGDYVINSQPSASGAAGWGCVFNLSTTLTADEPTSETVMAVTSGTSTANGDIIGVKLDSGYWHFTTIASGGGTTSLTLTSGLPSAAATGNEVFVYRFKATANLAA